jgi:hypothetical protein
MVFLGSSCRETAKKSMGKDERKKVFFPQLFRPKVFDMYFPQKVFYGVFELPLLRNAQKRHKKNLKNHTKKEGTYLPDLSSARYTSLSILFFFGAPRARACSEPLMSDVCRLPSALCRGSVLGAGSPPGEGEGGTR